MGRSGRRTFLTTCLGLAALAGPLLAQADPLDRVRSAFGEVHAARITAAIDAGVERGAPRSLLVEKAVEGATKRTEPDAVLGAVRVLTEELLAAGDVVGADAEAETLSKTADALRHGVDGEVLTDLHRRDPEHYPMLVVAIEDLLHSGVRLEVAQSMIRDAAVRGLRGDDVLALPATVRRLVREGRTPGEAASSVLSGLRRRGRPVPPVSRRSGLPDLPAGTRVGRRIPPV